MPVRVHVHDLHKRYSGVEAVCGVSLEVEAGEIFGLIGPNGAGKTTTIECIVGLREPDLGRIDICGIDARARSADVKQRIGVALQTTALQDQITPREALALFGSFYRDASSPQVLLDRFAIAEVGNQRFDSLSGGQRQRLALALALVSAPDVIVLDEPTSDLDPQARRELRAEIAQMRREGHAVLLTTHDIDEAESLCDRVGILHHGRIVATGTPRDLVSRSAAAPTLTFATSSPLEKTAVARLPAVGSVSGEGARYTLRTTDLPRTLAALAALVGQAHVELLDLHVQRASLEDLLIDLTTGSTSA